MIMRFNDDNPLAIYLQLRSFPLINIRNQKATPIFENAINFIKWLGQIFQMNNQEKDLQVEAYNEACMEEKYSNGRREVLNELWTSDKILKDGYWFVKLTDVIKIIDNYRN